MVPIRPRSHSGSPPARVQIRKKAASSGFVSFASEGRLFRLNFSDEFGDHPFRPTLLRRFCSQAISPLADAKNGFVGVGGVVPQGAGSDAFFSPKLAFK